MSQSIFHIVWSSVVQRSKSSPVRRTKAEVCGEYRARPLVCQSDELTVQLGTASHSFFPWINFLLPAKTSKLIYFGQNMLTSHFLFHAQRGGKKTGSTVSSALFYFQIFMSLLHHLHLTAQQPDPPPLSFAAHQS